MYPSKRAPCANHSQWRSPGLSAQISAWATQSSSGTYILFTCHRITYYVLTRIISGAGPIGLVSLLSARAAGAEPIVITDLFQSRLDFAKSMVPGVRTVLIERGLGPKEQAEKIKAAADGNVKLALECTGVESSIHTAIYVSEAEGSHSSASARLLIWKHFSQ